MARPHPALVPLAGGAAPGPVPETDDGLLASALDHGMQGLLWSWVRVHAPAYSERVRLAGVDAATRQHHARLWSTLTTVRHALDGIDVEVATVKGVTAEARWYGREGERPCGDVDVLVHPDAVARADAIVAALQPDHPLRGEIGALAGRGTLPSVNVHVDGVSVDVHFDLLKLGIPMRARDAVWACTRPYPLPDGATVRVLDPELALVHFLVHANKDSFPQLLGFADVARVLACEQIDWEFVTRFLHDEGLDVIVPCALGAVIGGLGLAWPDGAPRPAERSLRTRLWQVAWPPSGMLLGSTGTARSRRQDLLPFLVRGRAVDALGGLAHVVAPPPSSVALRYPDLRGPYPWRVARGRVRAWRARRAALDARHEPRMLAAPADHPSPAAGPALTAHLLRTRAEATALWLPVSGRSMGWSVRGGSRVRIEPGGMPRAGEVWAFCDARGAIVVHRARGRAGPAFRFQGDACVRPDAPVDPSHLLGRVVELAPRRPRWSWGPGAGAVQRVPRRAVATGVRAARRLRRRDRS